jgi:peptide/nickel transport system ATP-binding protein
VLYQGEIVEFADVATFFSDARHPYSLQLIGAASYQWVGRTASARSADAGAPNASGCVFLRRCPLARTECLAHRPELMNVSPMHTARCHFWQTSREGIGVVAD